ncbi:MAG: hypothetical protein LUF30_13100, partial [Lachnospiraceae bacterium]|nr:hypothetical protein [Lachnospiraceae bacterium]
SSVYLVFLYNNKQYERSGSGSVKPGFWAYASFFVSNSTMQQRDEKVLSGKMKAGCPFDETLLLRKEDFLCLKRKQALLI